MPLSPLVLRREDDDSSLDEPLMPSLERLEEPLMPSLERLDEPLMPSLERPDPRDDELLLLEPLRLELLEPDDALRPSLSELDEPFAEALRLPEPERSCELLRPEFVLPEAPRPSLRLLLSPIVLLRSLDSLELRSLDDEPPWLLAP